MEKDHFDWHECPKGGHRQLRQPSRDGVFFRVAAMTSALQSELEQHVQTRTGRRIRNLCVELSPDGIILRGQTDSFYAKQLAQHGIRDLMPEVHLNNAITVV
jgi:hypothetical protein